MHLKMTTDWHTCIPLFRNMSITQPNIMEVDEVVGCMFHKIPGKTLSSPSLAPHCVSLAYLAQSPGIAALLPPPLSYLAYYWELNPSHLLCWVTHLSSSPTCACEQSQQRTYGTGKLRGHG